MGDASGDLNGMTAGQNVQAERIDPFMHQEVGPDIELRKQVVHGQETEHIRGNIEYRTNLEVVNYRPSPKVFEVIYA